jgi:hypothetical protein
MAAKTAQGHRMVRLLKKSFSKSQARRLMSLIGTKRKCGNARAFPELGVDRLCHSPVGHSRP